MTTRHLPDLLKHGDKQLRLGQRRTPRVLPTPTGGAATLNKPAPGGSGWGWWMRGGLVERRR